MIRRILQGAAEVAALPIRRVGYWLVAPVTVRDLNRCMDYIAKAAAVADRMGRKQGETLADFLARIEGPLFVNRERLTDAQCSGHGMGQEHTVAEVAKMLGCEATIGAVEAAIDEVQRKLNMANGTVAEQIEALRAKDNEIDGLQMSADELAWQQERARGWASLWHERAREYRRAAVSTGVDLVTELIKIRRERIGAEGRLEALRSAVRDALRHIEHSQKHKDRSAETLVWNVEARLTAALSDGTPPVQDAPPAPSVNHCGSPHITGPAFSAPCVQCGQTVHLTVPLVEGWKTVHGTCPRPSVEGDHPAGDPVTQQWAGIVEKLTRQRDEDTRRLEAAGRERDDADRTLQEMAVRFQIATRERDTLKRELADADRIHEGNRNELLARHREVLAERDRDIRRLMEDLADVRQILVLSKEGR